ncbi:ubiquitin-protein ligase E3C isoform X1 [Periplaneta americana]|uniref:ubiquitin-protein ligase E3C isoform X1 n=1 Tax=Periplaneta americana TaxID=6978 RepID=UPI0037E76FB0
MYSFEGEFRRKPQQNLSGASKKHERTELLQRAQNERLKREELRRRYNSTILIQAFVRGYLTRQHHKKLQRAAFDETVQQSNSSGQTPDEHTLAVLIQRLLFFYTEEKDAVRLVWISQLLLRQYEHIMVAAERPGDAWTWRLCRLLHMNVAHLAAATQQLNSRESLAVPLRTVEVFTSWETCQRILGDAKASTYLTHLFTYLVNKGYFEHVRCLVDNKVPPLLEASAHPPTPLAACLFDMITRPLQLVISSPVNSSSEFSGLILRGLCQHILAPPLTEPVKLFIIPALAELPYFPFRQLLETLKMNAHTVPASTWLLFAVLSLERKHFVPGQNVGGDGLLLIYLQILASLTVNISKVYNGANGAALHSSHDSDIDSNSEMDHEESNVEELQILEQCVEMLNESSRVQILLLAVDQSEDPQVLQALCQVCHNLLVAHKFAIHKYKLLYMLAFKPTFLRHLWTAILSVCQTSLFGSATPLLHVISRGIPMSPEDSDRIVPLLAVFCSLFSLLIATLHDSEFYADDNHAGAVLTTMPFPLSALVPLSLTLKEVCLGLVELAFPDSRPSVRDDYRTAVHGRDRPSSVSSQETQMWAHLFKVTVGLVRQLHARDIRRPFCPDGHWISKQVMIPLDKPSDFTLRRHRLRNYRPFQGLRAFTREELEEGPPLSTKEVRTMTILRELPFLVAFQERVLVFQSLVLKDKMEHQGEQSHFLQGPSIQVAVRRNYLYEDAFDKLSPENEPELRLKMRVQLVNVVGMDEAGVDGGGVFREFLSELLKTAFDPNRGFFRLTKDHQLYPSPNVHLLVEDFPRHYYFIGRILGKALYENLLVELPLAEFFLSKLVGRHSDVDVHHLASLDPVMYRNLLFLKSYEGDVADLGLDFTVLNDELGETRVDELKPGGSNIPVTASNRIEYIHLMADYKLNKQIRAQCNAFKQGLANVVPLEWLQMFNNKELQVLISGAQIPVDVEDLKQHTNYTGGYASDHPTIRLFWKVVENFTDLQRRQLLKFVTSCSRPPLLGFKELDPPFCVQHAGSVDRLPTASTCMNLLKLPEFGEEVILRDKLLYAIQAGAGFELS